MSRWGVFAKRMVDLVITVPMSLLLALPMFIFGLAIKLEDRGSVFFRQERIGRDGVPFRVWKFRTMAERSVSSAPDPLRVNDARITRVGKFLRGFGLDELPQLLNVLSGEMSLVGPRPTLRYQVEAYDAFQRRRLEAKPGITSLAVVSGRNALPWVERIKLDVWYIDHWSLGLDIKILFRTLWRVLVTREGLYGEDGVNDMFVDAAMKPRGEEQEGDRGGET